MTAVVRFSAPTGPSIVTKADIEELIHEVVWESGHLPVLSTEVAADAAANGVPYLVVDITIDERVGHADPGRILRYVVSSCWRNAAGQAARATCPRAHATMSGSSSVTLLTLRLARVIKQELEWLGHVHEP